jgi:hypothetical protein
MQHHPAEDLDVEMPQADLASRDLTHEREGLHQQPVERLPARCPLSECPDALAEANVRLVLGSRLILAEPEAALRARGREVVRISGATGEGVGELLRAVLRAIDAEAAEENG